MNKYRNKKETRIINGEEVIFDSQAEAFRFDHLKLMLQAGKIKNLTLQPEFTIMEGYRRNGRKIRDVKYIPDFKYTQDGDIIIEDVKGKKTKEYNIKKKLFLKIHGEAVRFFEVTKVRNGWAIHEI